jgi:hypothetical protein
MKHRKEEHLRVAEFRKLCGDRGQEVPVIDVGADDVDGSSGVLPCLPPVDPPLYTGDDGEVIAAAQAL